MDYIDISELRSKVDSGSEIIWMGSYEESNIIVRLNNGTTSEFRTLNLSTLPKPSRKKVVKHVEATTEPLKTVDVTWHHSGWLKSIRTATIYGINIYSRCLPGFSPAPKVRIEGCTMGYDIETSQHLTSNGSFPPPQSRITSIALWCSCGFEKAWTTIKCRSIENTSYCNSSKELVRMSLEEIKFHMPQWLVGYNCYQFDNCSLKYHCPEDMEDVFRPIASGSKYKPSHAFYIDILGVNNVDLYTYLDKCLRGQYSNLGLDTVSKEHGLDGKLQMPTSESSESLHDLIKYNISDSKLTALLWHRTGACSQAIGLCVASCSPILDCVRYITGTMVSCAVSSFCISSEMMMDWSRCDLRIGYEGGTVLEPNRGLHRNVTVCDFSSMYPTIMRDIGVSPENIEVLDECSGVHEDKILWWTDKSTLACIRGRIVRYSSTVDCMTRRVLGHVLDMRGHYKKSNIPYSTALKVLANSLYGALGYADSPLHSPRAAATVTTAGRTVLAIAYKIFEGLGLTVIYGDTDSCFISAGRNTSRMFDGNTISHVNTALKILHRVLYFTAIPSMKMEREREFSSLLLVDKKHYAYSNDDGEIKMKGLSRNRKDRLGICRDITGSISSKLLLNRDTEAARIYIVKFVDACFRVAMAGQLDMHSISKEVRYEGVRCYNFTDEEGEEIYVPVSMADKVSNVRYNIGKVLKVLESDLNRLCIPSGIGNVRSLLSDADIC